MKRNDVHHLKPTMEILMTAEYYVIVDGEHTLWCSRIDGTLEPGKRECLSICVGPPWTPGRLAFSHCQAPDP